MGKTSGRPHPEGRPESELAAQNLWPSFWHPHDPGRRFHALYDKVSRRDVLERAWELVRRNRGAPGIDQVTIQQVELFGVDRLLGQLAASLKDGCYQPQLARRVFIPKPGTAEQRPLSIPRSGGPHRAGRGEA